MLWWWGCLRLLHGAGRAALFRGLATTSTGRTMPTACTEHPAVFLTARAARVPLLKRATNTMVPAHVPKQGVPHHTGGLGRE